VLIQNRIGEFKPASWHKACRNVLASAPKTDVEFQRRNYSGTQWEFYNLSFADFALVPNDTIPFDHTLVAVGTNLS
jgi:hypothetical protein